MGWEICLRFVCFGNLLQGKTLLQLYFLVCEVFLRLITYSVTSYVDLSVCMLVLLNKSRICYILKSIYQIYEIFLKISNK